MLLFVLQWVPLHWQILIMLPHFPLTSNSKWMHLFIVHLCWLGQSFWSVEWYPEEDILSITMFFSSLCCCHGLYRSVLLFVKWSLDRLVIITRGFFKLLNLLMIIKQKSPSLPRNVALATFDKLVIMFSSNLDLLYFLCLMDLRWYLLLMKVG